jgi:hypothetical protein
MHKIIHNVETGEITQVELTPEEVAEFEAAVAEAEAQQLTLQQEENAKAIEKTALLAQLGITADQAKLLLS